MFHCVQAHAVSLLRDDHGRCERKRDRERGGATTGDTAWLIFAPSVPRRAGIFVAKTANRKGAAKFRNQDYAEKHGYIVRLRAARPCPGLLVCVFVGVGALPQSCKACTATARLTPSFLRVCPPLAATPPTRRSFTSVGSSVRLSTIPDVGHRSPRYAALSSFPLFLYACLSLALFARCRSLCLSSRRESPGRSRVPVHMLSLIGFHFILARPPAHTHTGHGSLSLFLSLSLS